MNSFAGNLVAAPVSHPRATTLKSETRRITWATLVAVLLLPLLSMTIIPFYDTSEPRYAEIARIMMTSGDWITPWFSPGVPFWGKPPLSFWAQALSMKLFGLNEFAARLPSWVCLLLSNAILISGVQRLKGRKIALWTAIIYSTCALVYISSGAVLTDPFLTLGTTLSLMSFATITQRRHTTYGNRDNRTPAFGNLANSPRTGWWSYGFFSGLVIGLLAKGPLALVLIGVPVAAWSVLNRKEVRLATLLPWRRGLLLVAILVLPWYVLAEVKTPGFLSYFIVGEHFRRFVDPGWAGDLYGSAHKRAYGTIWYLWLQATFPYGPLLLATLIGALFSARLRDSLAALRQDPLLSYWLACALFVPVFFTFSANILWTYLLPSLAGFSVLAASIAMQIKARFTFPTRRFLVLAGLVPFALLIFSLIDGIYPDLRNTERTLVSYVQQHSAPNTPVLYLSTPPFSAQFYSRGRARQIEMAQLRHATSCNGPFYLAVPKHQQGLVAQILDSNPAVELINRRYVLMKILARDRCPRADTAALTPSR